MLGAYITDSSDEGVAITYKLDDKEPHGGLLCEINTKRQNVKIVKTVDYGYALFLDGRLQSTEKDEYIYHETIVHSLMMNIPSSKKVLVLGGSEGCMIRELLKWPSIEQIHQVDWDRTLVNLYEGWPLCLMNQEAYKNSKVNVFYEDAYKFLETCQEIYDAIFVDLLDPNEECLEDFKELIELSMSRLAQGGGIIMNAGSCIPSIEGSAEKIAEWLLQRYPDFDKAAMHIHVPSYMQEWCLLSMFPSGRDVSLVIPEGLKFFDKETYAKITYWSKDWQPSLRSFTSGKWIGSLKIGDGGRLQII